MSKPSITNCPNTFFIWFIVSTVCIVWMVLKVVIQQSTFNITYTFACVQIRHTPLSGGYCGEVPPLPIPNREVKLTCADGTAMQCGRLGSRLLSISEASITKVVGAFLFSCGFCFLTLIAFLCWFFLSRRFGFPFGRRFSIRRWRRLFQLLYPFTILLFYFSTLSPFPF